MFSLHKYKKYTNFSTPVLIPRPSIEITNFSRHPKTNQTRYNTKFYILTHMHQSISFSAMQCIHATKCILQRALGVGCCSVILLGWFRVCGSGTNIVRLSISITHTSIFFFQCIYNMVVSLSLFR